MIPSLRSPRFVGAEGPPDTVGAVMCRSTARYHPPRAGWARGSPHFLEEAAIRVYICIYICIYVYMYPFTDPRKVVD